MDTPLERREWIEALYAASREGDKLLRIIVQLGGNQEKADIVNLLASVFSETPVEKQNVVLVGDFALRFDENDKLAKVFRPIPGTTERAETEIRETRHRG